MPNFRLKSDRGNLLYILLAYFGLMIVPVRFLIEKYYAVGLPLTLVFTVFAARWYLAVFRTVLIDQNGITISFYRWKKTLPWSQITVQRQTYHSLGRNSSGAAIVFEKADGHFRKPAKVQPFLYNLLVQPFTFVYAYIAETANFSGPMIYPISENAAEELLRVIK